MNSMHRLLLVLAAWIVWAQPRPEFDVASLKPVILDGKDSYRANLGSVQHGVLTMTNVTLADCLRVAYGIPTEDQIAGPAWIKSKRSLRHHSQGLARHLARGRLPHAATAA